ncbi:MAG: NAD(P)-binding protein [Bosea sp. (in: a-proteobacteria)]
MSRHHSILVVGGGIVGVFAALRVRQLRPQAQVVLVEQDDALGGLLRSDAHSNGLMYDRGTHVLSETGIASIDGLLFDDLDAAEWRRFGGAERDLAGLLMDETVLEGSPFLPAPRTLVKERLAIKAADAQAEPHEHQSLHETLLEKHGAALTDAVFRNPVRNLYRCELEELDRFVAGQLPLSRVVADDLTTWLARMDDEPYRALVACPEQRSLPAQYTNTLSAMYPRRMGIGQLFGKLSCQMAEAGVELRLSTRITGLSSTEGRITSVALESAAGSETVNGSVDLIWAVPPFQLGSLLGGVKPVLAFKPGWRTVIVDFAAKLVKPLGCYYYIDYGDNDGFRLTNYAALSEEAAAQPVSPFTLELWWRGGELDDEEARALVAQRFLQLGLITAPDAISDVRLRRAAQGVLLATTGNMAALGELADTVRSAAPSNLLNIGLLSEPRLFFTGDMLRNAEKRLRETFS